MAGYEKLECWLTTHWKQGQRSRKQTSMRASDTESGIEEASVSSGGIVFLLRRRAPRINVGAHEWVAEQLVSVKDAIAGTKHVFDSLPAGVAAAVGQALRHPADGFRPPDQ